MTRYWAICKQCKNNLLEVYFKGHIVGARCGLCKKKVFELDGSVLEAIEKTQEKHPSGKKPIKKRTVH